MFQSKQTQSTIDRSKLKLRKARKDDLDDQLNLIGNMRERTKDERMREIEAYKMIWNWRYEKNPKNPDGEPQIWVIEYDGRVIGQYPTIPVVLYCGGKSLTGSWGGAFAVDPLWRGQGLGTILIKEGWWKSANISLATGMTEGAINLYGKLKYISLGRLRKMIRCCNKNITGSGPIGKRLLRSFLSLYSHSITKCFRLKTKSFSEFDFIKVAHFDDEVSNFALDACKGYRIIERRDKNYLNWRFIDNPVRNYSIYIGKSKGTILGYIVLRKSDLNGVIADILTRSDDKNAMKFLIQKGIEHFEELNVNYIVCLATDRDLKKTLIKAGFLPNIFTGKADGFMIHLNSGDLDERLFGNLDNWYLTTALSDRE